MEKRRLGKTDIEVSVICLGTMTWGEQNTLAQAHEQLDYALAHGVNFIDTAEMYPVPPREQTYASTEEIIGHWLKKRGKRDDIVLASKAAGPARGNDNQNYIRGGANFSKVQLHEACNASLKRLQTDYLDLYQLHWPERPTNCFGRLDFDAVQDTGKETPFVEVLETLQELQQAGKIRHIGLSNETPWGLMQYLRLHENQGLPPVVSVQNPYNLLNRSYEVGLAEMSIREQAGLLAYSPLAFGVLSGKYRHGAKPEGARLTQFDRFVRYTKPQAFAAVERYAAIAEAAGLSLATMALAFVNQRQFVSSNIIGATNLTQLAENIASHEVRLSADTLAAIDAVHADISNPCP